MNLPLVYCPECGTIMEDVWIELDVLGLRCPECKFLVDLREEKNGVCG